MRKGGVPFIWIAIFFSLGISGLCFSQDFTAKTIGDYGNVTVMEVTGNYDAKNPDGSVNDIPRQIIAKEFFKTHKDVYDFLVIFSNFDFEMPDSEAKAFYYHVKNEVRGIGLDVFDDAALFGSGGKLQGVVDMGNLSGLVVDPLDPGFEETSYLLSHEIVHRWGAYVKFKDKDGNISNALLGRDGTHWSFLLDSRASVLYGNQWQDNGDGTFTSIGARRYYSPLDLYLMGFYDKSQVSPMLLIDNPAIDPATLPAPGATISGTPRTITIDDILAAEGERIPGPSDSQKIFRTACILITAPGTYTGSELQGIETIMRAWVTRFSILTDGQGIIDADLMSTEDIPTNPGIPVPPFTPRALPPDIEDGVRWLMSNQRSDGNWIDLPQTAERETAEVVLALKHFDIAKENFSTGLLWLEATYSGNTDYLARKIETFANAGMDVKSLSDELLSRQNSDRGWGSNRGYMSNPTDTSFALRAMAVAGYSDPSVISKAIEYLTYRQNADGGWGNEDEASSIQSTANVLSAFNQYRKGHPLDDHISRGIAWLLQRQNPDGGFGNSPSTIYDTAIAISTLREFGVSTDAISRGLNYILNLQSADGSWYGSSYQTAVAVSSVWKATIDPDLSIKTDDIIFTPPSVTTVPSNITIDATIWNLGRTDVPQVEVALYEGTISAANKIAQQTRGFPGQSSVTLSFPVTINDGNEHRFYISLDPENLVKESNESNNKALNILYPLATYDLEILPSDFSVSPNLVDIFQDVKISSRIRNKGTINAYNVQIKYYIDEPGNAFDIATATVDVPAGSTIINEITWRTNKAGKNLKLTTYVDPFNSYDELSEGNNQAFTYLTVRGSTDPNLTVSYKDIVMSPSPAKERGSTSISALVKNEGFSTATSVKVNFYKGTPGEDGVLLGSQIIPSLDAGGNRSVSIDWMNIMESGERVIYVQVDPENQINEIKEDDNSSFIPLKILSLPDLTLSTNSITFSPPAPKDGDTVAVTVAVQNKGEQNALNVTVRVREGDTVIGSQIIPSIAGNSQGVATIAYYTTGKSGPHHITVVVDPDKMIPEQSEDNNEASRSFGVQDANLWVTEQYISPNGDGVKDSTQFFFRLNTPQTVKIAVVNKRGETVRTFSGSDFENTAGGNIEWDGLNDKGMVVSDGQYQIKVLDINGNNIGSLLVIVDNNRSPLTEAVGTKYLLNTNLTCLLPDIDGAWAWFPDESGILFHIDEPNKNTPEYPTGLYTMSPDGEDILRIVPWEWSEGVYRNYDIYLRNVELSPNGEKVAFDLLKRQKVWGESEFSQLWAVDRDGSNLKLLDSYDLSEAAITISDLKWSPNGQHIVYLISNNDSGRYELWMINADGSEKRVIDDDLGNWYMEDLVWSPDSNAVAYVAESYDADGNCVAKIRLSDLLGNKQDIFNLTSCYTGHSITWLNHQKIILVSSGTIWLIDASGGGNHIELSGSVGYWAEVYVAPDTHSFAFFTYSGSGNYPNAISLNISDRDGNVTVLHELTATGNCCCPYFSGIVWSPDSRKISFRETIGDCDEGCYCREENPTHSYVIDIGRNEKIPFVPSIPSTFIKWLSDGISIIGSCYNGVCVTNSETGQSAPLTSEGFSWYEDKLVSPHERYITYHKYIDPTSVCYGRGYNDLWAVSSLLNLTADLRVKKEKTAVILKGIAVDLNFEGYLLEYADIKSPEVWNPIGPPSEVPVINDVFTTWVPPYEGTFYVRLTVWDRAGNVARDIKRVSWGLSATITNLYKTLEVFSPNGDGVKDTVELHYRVLEPVHLEVNLYDAKNHLIRTFAKDYTLSTDDIITWDGRDESGDVVPDGKYKIKVFDYEFFVDVDNTPPLVNTKLMPVDEIIDSTSEIDDYYANLLGHAFDHHIKHWVIEFGEGDNPEEWHGFLKGEDLLVGRDESGNMVLNPIKDASVGTFLASEMEIEWLVGKKFKISAEDHAGNKMAHLSGFLEETITLYRWDGEAGEIYSIFDKNQNKIDEIRYLDAHLAQPGLHSLKILETIRLPIVSVKIQYWDGIQWFDTPSVKVNASGLFDIEWDNSHLSFEGGYALRIEALDILGQKHHSKEIWVGSFFWIETDCDDPSFLRGHNSLFEKLTLLELQMQNYPWGDDSPWIDYQVWDAQKGDVIPQGDFPLATPPMLPGVRYKIRMIGTGVSGELYKSDETDFPPTCISLDLEVYPGEGDCGSRSEKATLIPIIEMKGFLENISLKTLSYYIEKPNGLQLLHQSDLTQGGAESVEINTLGLAEGSYSVRATLSYLDLAENEIVQISSGEKKLSVDRVLPTARITYPAKSTQLCPIKISDPKGDWYGIPIEGIAMDNNQVERYELYYGIGEDPTAWTMAATREKGKVVAFSRRGAAQGALGIWDITYLQGKTFSIRLKVIDGAGNVSCDTLSFSFDSLIEIARLLTDKLTFSPNGDEVLDELETQYEIDEYAIVDVKVFRLVEDSDGSRALDSTPLRTLRSGSQHLGGTERATWDGRDEANAIVPDGPYGLAVFAKDACGNQSSKWVAVEVDNTPPQTIITYPGPSDPLGNIVEVRGSTGDVHFESYVLEVGKGEEAADWLLVSSKDTPVKEDVLGTWNTTDLEPGKWALKLTATDRVGNRNATTVTVDLNQRKELIKGLTATPRLFSPNGDGKLDTTGIDYELTAPCEVRTEIFNSNGTAVKTYSTTVPSPGTYHYPWDGKNDAGSTVPDGTYLLLLTVRLSSNPLVMQEEKITLVVDSTLPVAAIQQPLNNSYLKGPVSILGTVSDKNLAEYSISYTGDSGTILLDKAYQSRENYLFGILPELPEGPYTLYAEAKDLGENITRKNISFTVDRTPPKATLESPKDAEYYGAEKETVSITGSITEKNLEAFSLRYGSGDNPTQWIDLAVGNAIPVNPQLFSWKIGKNDGIPDGVYTLSLYAKDKAGLTGKAKVKITIDNTPPTVSISSLKEGQYIKAAAEIRGTASDPNLEKYALEISEGQCSSAFKWALLKTSTTSVNDGLLAIWQALPPDGDYCLRLTAVDKIGNKGEAKVQVKVDTHPPAAPVLSGKIDNKTEARLNWTPNREPDLAGYNLYRENQKINTELITSTSYLDQNLREGIYRYLVKALDFAGNESKPSNEERVKVDFTPPDARIRSPQDGSKVCGLVNIKGTAYSSEDFKEYRVSVGEAPSPSAWSLIRTSPVPVSYGTLTQWDTIGLEGSYSIRLEAQDLSGNISTHQTVVTIDNIPPAKPVLLSATRHAPPNDSDVTVTWQANTESDLAGYLLYRNDQLANVSGIVIGDLSPYLIIGTTYADKALPDGKFNYYLIAVDLAGNMSEPSNTLEVEIDTHSPRATIVEPMDKSKFQSKTLIRAETPDIDMASVQFQYKRAVDSDTSWANLGTAVKKSPYITYIDPVGLGLIFGDYNLRAIATDLGGRTDSTPPSIIVTYTDLTSPEAPKELKALTMGKDVRLTWAANKESDLKGYNIYRTAGATKTKVNSSVVIGATYLDQGLPDGSYSYEVTALDTYGNESELSNSAAAKVYAPSIEQPYTPTGQKVIEIKGRNAASESLVEVFISSSSAGIVKADGEGNFVLEQLNLNPGENRITAKATDDAGNISRSSEMVVVVHNMPPSAPIGLDASVQNYGVNLTWNPNSESDLSGYSLYRDGVKLNQPIAVTSGNITASSFDYYRPPTMGFDSNLSTYWMSSYSYRTFTPVWWEIDLQSSELISHLEIHWTSEANGEGGEVLYAGKDYEIQLWSGYAWVTQTKVTGNAVKDNMFDFKPSYRTDMIRIYVTDTTGPGDYKRVGISEVAILKENLITETSYDDNDLHDGDYRYKVTAIDYYGFESEPSVEVMAIVGDVIPPGPPQNLQAQTSGHDVVLTWTPDGEMSLAGYNVYRNTPQGWLKLNTVLIPEAAFTDTNLKNGTYSYRVTAVDNVGNESLPSNEASTTVYVEPPQPPENLRVSSIPEGHGLRAMWDYTGGVAAGFNLYRSPSSGGPYIKINSSLISLMTFLDQGLTNGVTYYYVVTAADAFGNESGYSNEAMGTPSDQIPPPKPEIFFPTLPGTPVVLYKNETDIAGNADPASKIELYKGRALIGEVTALEGDIFQSYPLDKNIYGLALSPDGKTLAYRSKGSIWLKDLDTGNATQIVQGGSYPIWSPEGRKLSYQFTDENGIDRIGTYDIETGQSFPLTNDGNGYYEFDPSWSSDATKVAFSSDRGGMWNIWIKDLVSGSLTQVTHGSDAYYPTLSPDGKKVAYFDDEGLSVVDILRGETVRVDPGNDLYSLSWSPDSKRLAFASYRTGNGDIFIFNLEILSQTRLTATTQDEFIPLWSPEGGTILFTRQDDNSSLYAAPSDGQRGERAVQKDIQNLNYLFWTKSGEIAYATQDQLNIVSLKGHFRFKDVALDSGENLFYAISIDSSGRVSLPSDVIAVFFDTSKMPDLEVTIDDVFIYPPSPVAGEEVVIDVTVWNRGSIEAKEVNVNVYLWDSGGRVELLKSSNIPYLAPASGEVIPMTWSTGGETGTNKVIVVVDPYDRINEVLETNNSVTKEFFVLKEEKISMTTTLDANQYGPDQDVKITIRLQNSSSGRDVVVEARIEDLDGNEVISLDPIRTYLAYGSHQTYSLLWNTGATYAGSYRVRTLLKNEPTVVAENLVPFSILPEIDIEATVVTDRASYDSNQDVLVRFDVKSRGRNYAIPQLNGRVRIVDPGNRDVFSEEKEIRNLLAGMTTTLNSIWNTGLHQPGDYEVVFELSLEGQGISRQTAWFKVNASVVLSGQLAVSPPLVLLGNTVQTNYTLQNSGNADVKGLGVKVAVVDLETQTVMSAREETIDLIMNSSQTGQMTFSTEGYGIKTYGVNLDVVNQGNQTNIAKTSFAVKDGTPPVVSVLSPILDRFYNSKVDISALATDYVSGIDKVEYQMDGGPWMLLLVSDPSQGRYSATWDPLPSDEGVRTVSIRATDRAGNMSPPVSVRFTFDLTPPNPPVIQSPPANSILSTETIEIKGTAEPGSTVEMAFGSTFRTKADSITGEFVYTGVKLTPGENKFVFKASDRAGNVSLATEYTLYLVKRTIEAKKTIPDVKNLVVWVNEKCRRDHPGHRDRFIQKDPSPHTQCHDDHKKKCIRLDLLERILDEAADSYLILNDREDLEKVKVPYYTDILILGDHHFLSEPYRDELRELVYAGKGLISSLYLKRDGCLKETDESLFGVEYEGHLSGDEHQVHFIDSPISEEIWLEAKGKAVRIEVGDPEAKVVAWIADREDRDDRDDRDEHHHHYHYKHEKHQGHRESKKHRCHQKPEKHPGVVLNRYGLGNTVFFAFDVGSTLDDQNFDQVSTILKNTLAYVHKPLDIKAFHPYQMVPIEVELRSLGSAMDIRITESYPRDIRLYDPLTGKWIIDRPWVMEVHLEAHETRTIYFYALMPDAPGSYSLQTEVGYFDQGIYELYENLDMELLVERGSVEMVDEIIGSLKSLSVSKKDKWKVKDALEHMQKIQRRGQVTAKDIRKNIDDLLEAIDSLLAIKSADISEIRLMMDVLLEVHLGKLILVSSP